MCQAAQPLLYAHLIAMALTLLQQPYLTSCSLNLSRSAAANAGSVG